MEKQKVLINKDEYDQKLKRLEAMGIDPNKLKNHNVGFFNAIVMKMSETGTVPDGITSHKRDSDLLWWSLGNKELAKKFEKEEKPAEQTEDDVKRLLDKMKKPSGKKSIRGKRKK